jgi:AbrB family looped-hinge helix DNA binding protein
MNLAKVSANGQVTVPVEIRNRLNLKTGDKLLFLEQPNGDVVIKNSSLVAISQAQDVVAGVDFPEDEILDDVINLRYGKDPS